MSKFIKVCGVIMIVCLFFSVYLSFLTSSNWKGVKFYRTNAICLGKENFCECIEDTNDIPFSLFNRIATSISFDDDSKSHLENMKEIALRNIEKCGEVKL